MKNYFMSAVILSSLVASTVFATVDFETIPMNKAWGLTCNMVDSRGHGTTDYQVTHFKMGGQLKLQVKFVDSIQGDNFADVLLTSVQETSGGGTDILTYKGSIVNGARGNMFNGKKALAVVVDLRDSVFGKPNTYRSKIVMAQGQKPALPEWAQSRELQCELVPQ